MWVRALVCARRGSPACLFVCVRVWVSVWMHMCARGCTCVCVRTTYGTIVSEPTRLIMRKTPDTISESGAFSG